MKPRKLTLISITLLATLLIGAGAILVTSQKPVGANVAWKPKYFEWDGTPAGTINAEVWLKGGHKAQKEIDPATILLEGMYSPSAPTYPKVHGPRLVVPFSGLDVKAALEPKLPHMEPGAKFRIKLKISGYLLPEYGELYFEGYGVITVTIPSSPPP